LRPVRTASKAALFCSGVFFGGAVDHSILALKGEERTPYGLRASVAGNWMLAALDALAAAGLYVLYRHSEAPK
jgi:hypothetical protein